MKQIFQSYKLFDSSLCIYPHIECVRKVHTRPVDRTVLVTNRVIVLKRVNQLPMRIVD